MGWEDAVVDDFVSDEGFASVTRFSVDCIQESCATVGTVENKEAGCRAAVATFKAQNFDSSSFTCGMVCQDKDLDTCGVESPLMLGRQRRANANAGSNLHFLVVGLYDAKIASTTITTDISGSSYTSKVSEEKSIKFKS